MIVRRGITMMEVTIGVLLVGATLAATLQVVGPTARSSQLVGDKALAVQFAHELLAEIAAQPYKDPTDDAGVIGPESGEAGSNRSRFDDVDDYHGWSGPISTPAGVARSGLQGSWEYRVQVRWAPLATPSTNAGSDTGLKRVTVHVGRNGVLLATESMLRSSGFDLSRAD